MQLKYIISYIAKQTNTELKTQACIPPPCIMDRVSRREHQESPSFLELESGQGLFEQFLASAAVQSLLDQEKEQK